MRKYAVIILAVALAGCSTSPQSWRMKNADFWQRADIRTATHLDAVAAQSLLNRDIARCTVEVKDQERMAVIRNTIPADGRGVDPNSPEGYMAGWDTPEREGYLHAEHLPFHDFETCMIYRGWERISTVPHDVAHKSRTAWLDHVAPDRNKPAPKAQVEGRNTNSNDHSYFNLN